MPADSVRNLARDLAAADRAAVYGRTGSCLGRNGTLVSFLLDALNIVTGNLDREGGAMFGDPPIVATVTPLGQLRCADDGKAIEVTASNVDFLCRTNPDYGVMHATADAELDGCSQYEIYSYAFEPTGVLEVVGHK